jgi:SAM-dependent methyltransferase
VPVVLKVNLGSGPRAVPGWVCIDRSPNIWLSRHPRLKTTLRRARLLTEGHMAPWDDGVVRGDVRKLTFADGSVDAIYSSHTLEHIYLSEARQVLAEVARVLRSGGVLRLALPDARVLAQRLLDGHDATAGREFNEALLAHPEAPATGLRALVSRTGGHTHRWQPTAEMTAEMLHDVGLVDVTEHEFRSGDFPDLDQIETRPESFFLQARRP